MAVGVECVVAAAIAPLANDADDGRGSTSTYVGDLATRDRNHGVRHDP